MSVYFSIRAFQQDYCVDDGFIRKKRQAAFITLFKKKKKRKHLINNILVFRKKVTNTVKDPLLKKEKEIKKLTVIGKHYVHKRGYDAGDRYIRRTPTRVCQHLCYHTALCLFSYQLCILLTDILIKSDQRTNGLG